MPVDPAIMSELYNKLGVSSREATPTPMPEDPSMAAQAYEQYEELPLMQQLGLAVAPGTGHAIAAYETPMFAGETKEAIEEGNIPRALGQGALTGLSALGMIPGLGLGIRGVKAGIKAATKGLRKFDFEYDVSGPAYMYPGEGRKIVDQDPGRLTIEARNLDEAKKLFNIEKRATNEYKRMDKEWAGRWFTPQGNPASPRVTIGRIQEGDATHYANKKWQRVAQLDELPNVDETLTTDQAIKKLNNLDEISIEKYYDDLLDSPKYKGKKLPRTRKEVADALEANERYYNEGLIHQAEYIKKHDQLTKRIRVINSAAKLKKGKTTSREHRKVVADNMDDPQLLEEVSVPATPEEMAAALGKKRERGIIGLNKNIKQGTLTDVRLDIPAYNEHGIYIAAVQPVGGKTMYASTAVLRGPLKEDGTRGFVEFVSDSPGSLTIAEGGSKYPFAVMRGEWQNINPETAVQRSKSAKIFEGSALQKQTEDAESWVEIGFNPDRAGQFYNKVTGEPIFRAEEVIQVGEHVLAKNIQKATKTELRKLRVGPSEKVGRGKSAERVFTEKPRMFKKGGSVVERNPNTYNMRAI